MWASKSKKVHRSRREAVLERLWAGTIVVYSFGAAVVVNKTLRKYGVNPYLFFVIDICTSWPYGIATARIVINTMAKNWKAVRKWTWIAAITFVTPQVYILITAHHAPRDVYLIVIAVISFLIVFAIAGVLLQIRNTRKKGLSRT